jgi:hypothetical protein
LSRQFLRQAVFELPENIPPAKRNNALDLLVRKWSPFASTDYAVQWVDHRASVYAWNREHVEADITAAGYHPKRCGVWPETFLQEPLSNGHRLSAAADGYEGQMWQNGFLAATRWWGAVPSVREWLAFLRTAGLDLSEASLELPEPVSPLMLEGSWTLSATPVTDVWSLLQTERVAGVAAAVVAAPFLYLLGQAVLISVATAQNDAEMAKMAETNQAVRIDRSAALSNLDSVESYLSLELFPPQYEIIASASNVLANRDLVISEWSYDNGNLELTLDSSAPLDSTFYIEAFEKSGRFTNVSGTSGVQQRSLRLSMQVVAQEWPVQ